MRGLRRRRFGMAVAAIVLTAGACSAPLAPRDPQSVADEAFVFGAPLVTTVRTLQTLAALHPVNQLTWQTEVSTPSTRLVVAPNVDTIYVAAPMDLRSGPFVLRLPAITDRFYTFQFLDAYMENDASVGTLTNRGQATTYFIAPPGYASPTPAAMVRVPMRTLQFLLLGRFQVRDEADAARAIAYQGSVSLQPLRPLTAAPMTFGAPVGPPQALAESGLGFFDELGRAMAVNPPTGKAATRLARRMARVGIGPGKTPSAITNPATRRALELGLARGADRIAAAANRVGEVRDGWSTHRRIGTYGDDFELRAVVSRIGWGADVPRQQMYALSRSDAAGVPYTGEHTYSLRWSKDQLPPTHAFWSITVYDAELHLVANSEQRYGVRSTDALTRDPDGSLTLTFAHSSPGVSDVNRVPTPEGTFVLVFRNYGPTDVAVSDLYRPPGLRSP